MSVKQTAIAILTTTPLVFPLDNAKVALKMHAFFCDLQVDRLIRLQHAEALVRLMNYLFELRAQRSMARHSRAHLKPAQRLG